MPSVNASYEGIFKILDERYVETASDLPESRDLKPDMNVQSSGHIEGWIDVVGFRQMVREEGLDHLPGKPEDYAIVQSDAWAKLDCDGCSVDSLTRSVSVAAIGNRTVATLNVRLKWSQTICSSSDDDSGFDWILAEDTSSDTKNEKIWRLDDSEEDEESENDEVSCSTSHYSESSNFEDSELSPGIYPAMNEPEVIMTQYNNSMYENIGIKILNDNYTKISFKYHDKQAIRTSKILHVENNSKGVIYGNITELEQWKIEGTNISRFYNEILLDGNLSKMDINEFDIWVYNPYAGKKADPKAFRIERAEFAPQRSMNGLLIAVLGMVSTFTIGTLYLYNRAVFRWKLKLF